MTNMRAQNHRGYLLTVHATRARMMMAILFISVKCGENVVVYLVENTLHVIVVSSGDDYGILIREYQYVLAAGAIGAVAIEAAAPHLVAIALAPVVVLLVVF